MSTLRRFRAPGRVNLMGDHVDYHDGIVLPMAIDRDVVVAVADVGKGSPVRVTSDQFAGSVEVPPDGSADPASVTPAWGRTVAAVVRALAERGRGAVGMHARVTSNVPVGSGLSSSAAFEVALALALLDAGGMPLAPSEVATACQEAERMATGVPCGIMDQLTAVAGVRGHALLIDCRDGTVEPVAVPDDLGVVVAHSGVRRSLDATPYARRRSESHAVAAALGLASLRDATPATVADHPRARHVVREIERVDATAAAMASGDRDALARLFGESHASLRDDYEVSTPELDALVERLLDAGAIGARLTGAGFGGCVVALADATEAAAVAEAAGGFVVAASPGAGPVGP